MKSAMFFFTIMVILMISVASIMPKAIGIQDAIRHSRYFK